MKISRTPIALAVSALLASPLALAQEGLTESYSVNVNNSGSMSLSNSSISQTEQRTRVTMDIPVFSKAQAIVDDKQLNSGNAVINYGHDNNASVEDSAGNGASGNIGVNAASGDNNMQDNAAAIATADAYFVFGSAESSAMTTQLSNANTVHSLGSNNTAAVGTDDEVAGGAFAGAHGNIGINVASGNNNMQKNNLTVSSAPSRASMASVQNIQRSTGNNSANAGTVEVVMSSADITLSGGVSGSYSGNARGTTRGTSDQIGDVYPDVWTGDSHPSGEQIGHFDLDTATQGGSDLNQDGGALAFNNEGGYAGAEAGSAALNGSFTGTAVLASAIVHQSQNNANLRGNALAGAGGNIGVNIASGNGNMQNNSLSVAVSQPPVAAPAVIPLPGGEPTLR